MGMLGLKPFCTIELCPYTVYSIHTFSTVFLPNMRFCQSHPSKLRYLCHRAEYYPIWSPPVMTRYLVPPSDTVHCTVTRYTVQWHGPSPRARANSHPRSLQGFVCPLLPPDATDSLPNICGTAKLMTRQTQTEISFSQPTFPLPPTAFLPQKVLTETVDV